MDIKSWLRTVLQHYQDPDRTFRDVDAVLQTYLSLKPKMDTYTSNDGHTELLLCLHGTVPITYRSIPYNIPVAFWIPKEYPKASPIPFVKPTANMMIREDQAGQAIKLKHTFLELVAILQQVFAQEPPVYTKPTSIVGSPQVQPDSLLDKASNSQQQRQSMPSQPITNGNSAISHPSPDMLKWMGESTALYNMNQGLASMDLNNNLTKSTSLPAIVSMPYPQLAQTPTSRPGNGNGNVIIDKSNTHSNINGYSIQETLYRKVTDKLQQYNVSISGDMDRLLLQNRQLNEGEISIDQEFRALNDIKERLKYNNLILESKSKEINLVIEKVNGMPDVQVDEALCGTTLVTNQLFELVADDNAISDTVYFLAKALNSERIDLAQFMKGTWNELLGRQTHKHTATCRRRKGNQIMPMSATKILRPLNQETDSQITEEELVQLKPKFTAIKKFLEANTDSLITFHKTFDEFLQQIQVTSAEAYFRCIRATLKTVKVFIKHQPGEILINNYNRKILDSFRSAASAYFNVSEISAKEAAYKICRLRMSKASVGYIFIPTAIPELRQKIISKKADLATQDLQSVDCLQFKLIEHYIARSRMFKHLNLAQFAAYFAISPNKTATVSNLHAIDLPKDEDCVSNTDFSGESGKWYQLKVGSPQMYMRRRRSSSNERATKMIYMHISSGG
ncbi:hypothetical protein [Parasitella parasitica]|uniref:UEV domain-containing protein n=1 Tax=Parasitella parasitica TaxID=35722 RepID=A0A0B7NQD5_9FUNG|nr:hypothetical protein [Parasitella parasitica]